MNGAWPTRLAWIGGLLGLLAALLFFAPARWLANGVTSATQGQLQLVNARGTVWNGQADMVFTGGEGSRTQTALPRGLQWQLAPRLVSGSPAMALRLTAPCCTPEPMAITLIPRLGGAEMRVASSDSQWPAELLSGLGTPWNTLRVEGRLALRTPGMTLRWDQGRTSLQGEAAIEAIDIASRLSALRPLGSYRMTMRANAEGNITTLDLQTLGGALKLQGMGQWVGGRLRFEGVAEAAPEAEAALGNLLNIMGRRQGPRSLLSIG
ncbi:type II secretion system protein N [Hydrogenophaga laconesensis]|uniref:Type II secretion system protein N n=1 Tax=Hydrogenophaga laconesensis TaxID=1805971 RepID=A0ABU1VA98_9BURK|nr:type II secretion system protein N [Hydrogenophaga laconesensis]MDR7094375.1 general secretion pathway protein N [Hydrogenophaga laconesensis]